MSASICATALTGYLFLGTVRPSGRVLPDSLPPECSGIPVLLHTTAQAGPSSCVSGMGMLVFAEAGDGPAVAAEASCAPAD